MSDDVLFYMFHDRFDWRREFGPMHVRDQTFLHRAWQSYGSRLELPQEMANWHVFDIDLPKHLWPEMAPDIVCRRGRPEQLPDIASIFAFETNVSECARECIDAAAPGFVTWMPFDVIWESAAPVKRYRLYPRRQCHVKVPEKSPAGRTDTSGHLWAQYFYLIQENEAAISFFDACSIWCSFSALDNPVFSPLVFSKILDANLSGIVERTGTGIFDHDEETIDHVYR